MKTCITCRYSNELWQSAEEHCGDCIDDSTDDNELPRYLRSLRWEREEDDENDVHKEVPSR
jgi:hypothetical protein